MGYSINPLSGEFDYSYPIATNLSLFVDVDIPNGISDVDGIALINGKWTVRSIHIKQTVDTETVAPTDGDVLKYNGVKWEPSGQALSEYSDYDLSISLDTIANGKTLSYHNGSWSVGPYVGVTAYNLNDSFIDDVDLTTVAPTADNVLQYNGVNWVAGAKKTSKSAFQSATSGAADFAAFKTAIAAL